MSYRRLSLQTGALLLLKRLCRPDIRVDSGYLPNRRSQPALSTEQTVKNVRLQPYCSIAVASSARTDCLSVEGSAPRRSAHSTKFLGR